MIKLKNVNNELLKKTLAGTTAFVLTFSGVPRVVHAASSDYCTKNSSVSSNACYDEDLGTIEIGGNKFTLTQKANGSIVAEGKDGKYESKVEVTKDGTAKTSTSKKQILGFKKTNNEKFTIKNYTGDGIEIAEENIGDKDLRECVSVIEKYINSTDLGENNYIKDANSCPTGENCELAKNQTLALYQKYKTDLNNNNIIVKDSTALVATPMALYGYNSIKTGANVLEKLNKVKNIVSVASPWSLAALIVYEVMYLNITDYEEAIANEPIIETIDIKSLDDAADWIELEYAMEDVKRNSKDKNPNNDYFQAAFNSGTNDLFINFVKPLPIDKASKIIKKYVVDTDPITGKKIIDPFQIYTYDSNDASRLITYAGGVSGINGKINAAENHAFHQSYNNFNSFSFQISNANYRLKKDVTPGVYFWHFHFDRHKLNNISNGKHIFFGEPVVITKKDINNYSNRTFNLNDLEMSKGKILLRTK